MPDWDSEFEQRKAAAEAARQRRLAELRARGQGGPAASDRPPSSQAPRPAPHVPQELTEPDLPPWLKNLLDPTGAQLPRRSAAPLPPPVAERPTMVERQIQRPPAQRRRPQPAAPTAPAAAVSETEPKLPPVLSRLEKKLDQPAALPPPPQPAPLSAALWPLLHNPQTLRQAIILNEILSPPVSLR